MYYMVVITGFTGMAALGAGLGSDSITIMAIGITMLVWSVWAAR
jgi:hypothetical protein